ncbi:MAG: acyloxyacyl hydrolase [Rhodospirillales bacterium]
MTAAVPALAQAIDPQARPTLPRTARFYDPGTLDLGGAARVPASPDAYRRPYDQYLGGWREPPPPLQSAYHPAPQWSPPPPAAWGAERAQPPLQEVLVASTAAAPPPAAPIPPAPAAAAPGKPGQLAQAAPAPAAAPASAPPAEDRLRYGAGSKYGLSELRFGLLAHNRGPIASRTEDGAQINMEARFASPGFLSLLFEPRPTIGASINTAGDTSFLYGGLTWGGFVWKGLFVEGFFGMAVHDGWLDSHDRDPPRRLMGSRVVFREALEFGYRFLDVHSISFMVDHYSNAGWIAERNQGNDDFGLRYGYKF